LKAGNKVTANGFSGVEARRLLRRIRHGALATFDRETGYPYASLVNFATDLAGLPVIFVSRLARHTHNLLSNPKASLLAARLPESGDILAGSRVTVLGELEPIAHEAIAERYGDHHPAARMYLDFPDFSFRRFNAKLVHGVAGFGRIETLKAQDVFLPEAAVQGFADLGVSAARHLNQDHADAVRLYATRLLGRSDGSWRVTSIDPDGAFLESEGEAVRLDFDGVATSAETLRETFVTLTNRARLM
jgi:heme oxygenase (biliverdin-IX-beta and delta-forming)